MSYFEKREEKNNYVKTKEYINWLENFCNIHPKWCDDSFNYDKTISTDDLTNVKLLSYFYSYIDIISCEQNVSKHYNDECSAGAFYFSINDNIYEIETICGQGAFTCIEKIEDTQEKLIVVADRKLTEEEIKERAFCLRILINNEYCGNYEKINNIVSQILVRTGAYYDRYIINKWLSDGALIDIDYVQNLENDEQFSLNIKDENNKIIIATKGILPKIIC